MYLIVQILSSVKKAAPSAAPKAVLAVKKAEPEAYSTKQLPVEDIDLDRDNPQLVSYYAKDIYQYLRMLEVSLKLFIFICHLALTLSIVRKHSQLGLITWMDTRFGQLCARFWLTGSSMFMVALRCSKRLCT